MAFTDQRYQTNRFGYPSIRPPLAQQANQGTMCETDPSDSPVA